jgi:hypothetical protein
VEGAQFSLPFTWRMAVARARNSVWSQHTTRNSGQGRAPVLAETIGALASLAETSMMAELTES